MKTVVITGGTRGLGMQLAENFKKRDFNVAICGTREETAAAAAESLTRIGGAGRAIGLRCDVSQLDDVRQLGRRAQEEFGTIDIWINNAGVNQSFRYAWELEPSEVDNLLNIDLKGTINGSRVAVEIMEKQGFGAIYNVEGMGSNDAFQPCFAVYGTAKRAVTYFSDALAQELKERKLPILVGKLSPGIMITDFLTSANGRRNATELTEKNKKVYNILGDTPDVIAAFLVPRMIENQKNGTRIAWLTGGKACFRFLTAAFNKRDFFGNAGK